MAEQAARARLTLDDDRCHSSPPNALGRSAVWCPDRQAAGDASGTYRARKALSSTAFSPACRSPPGRIFIAAASFHQRLNAPGAPPADGDGADDIRCRLLCFDEFHLHDPGDAMPVKALLEHLFQHGIVLLAPPSNPAGVLLPNRCITTFLQSRSR